MSVDLLVCHALGDPAQVIAHLAGVLDRGVVLERQVCLVGTGAVPQVAPQLAVLHGAAALARLQVRALQGPGGHPGHLCVLEFGDEFVLSCVCRVLFGHRSFQRNDVRYPIAPRHPSRYTGEHIIASDYYAVF